MRNRFHNITNPYQGESKRVLCVCSAGLLRSPTAANVLHKEFGFNTRAAGINHEYALIPLDDVLLEWADEVVVMEPWMYHQLETNQSVKKLLCLSIPDKFAYMDPELQSMILTSYKVETNASDTK